jgi:hypothetical protein
MAAPRQSQPDALKRLSTVLGEPPPGALAKLRREDIEDLAAAIDRSRRGHSEALSSALDNAFDQVPRLFRSTVRRIVTW